MRPTPPKPPTQLPLTQLAQGRYPASRATIWLVSVLVVISCAVLALGIPAL